MKLTKYRGLAFSIFTVLLVIMMVTAIITYTYQHHETENILLFFAVQNHVLIMIVLVIIAVGFGFFWSNQYYGEMKKQEKSTEQMIQILKMFLHKDEKTILNYLMDHKGTGTQAEMSKLPGMNRVKAHRALQRMEQKKIVRKIAVGKIKKIKLKENIHDALLI